MSSQGPVQPPQDPYKGYRVERVGEKKESQEEKPQQPFEELQKGRAAFLVLLTDLFVIFKKLLDLFHKTALGLSEEEVEELKSHLRSLNRILMRIEGEEKSQDASFLNNFSLVWHHLSDMLAKVQKNCTLFAKEYHDLLEGMQTYPANQEFTLGYYLTEYAGEKWLPFPFMDLIKQLHEEHQRDALESVLSHWVRQIDALLSQLQIKQSP